jgi:Protein of unknown function (DUF2726)
LQDGMPRRFAAGNNCLPSRRLPNAQELSLPACARRRWLAVRKAAALAFTTSHLPNDPHAMTLLDQPLWIALACAVVSSLLTWGVMRRRDAPAAAPKVEEGLDTIQAWPPQAVRVMTLGERQAYEILKRALPGHVILSQVPLSRFISVPTRNPYTLWLQRAGRLAVDLLVCDYSSRAVVAVEVRTADESKRSAKRHNRLVQVLRAAGVQVLEWDEDNLPDVVDARQLFIPKAESKQEAPKVDAAGRRLIPVPDIAEVLSHGDATDYGQLEPVPSAFYDDLDEPGARRAA